MPCYSAACSFILYCSIPPFSKIHFLPVIDYLDPTRMTAKFLEPREMAGTPRR